jgi:cytochrome c biogenesis protein CcdA/HEAT repeat protein/glutaredoxin
VFHQSAIALLFATLLHAGAQEPAKADDAAAASLAAYEKGDHSAERIAQLLPQLADPARRNFVRTRLMDPLPVAELVSLLKHNSLAVRLGALELLEEQAGGDFAFNPWNAPDMAENSGPLARWAEWATKDSGRKNVSTNTSLLGDDQRRGYLRDLLGQDDDKASRARYMLEADGLRSVTFLEDFLTATPALPAGGRARVRQAQYQIVLAPRLGPGASETGRNLAFGSRDQLLAALAAAKAAGPMCLPILRDFINHADPLVRETAIDSILTTGGVDALSLVAPVLEKEPDVNVIHGALRRLKDVPGEESAKLAASFLTHADEDLLVSAIQTCLKLAGGAEGGRGSYRAKPTGVGKNVEPAIIAALSDPRWRVRVAALEFVAGRKVSKASDTVLKLLDDPDEFVRFASIKTAAALELKSALPKLKAVFMANEAMTGPVLEGYAALDTKPDAEMLDQLAKASPEARIAAVRAAETNKDMTDLVIRFATDPDSDVACSALRFLSADADRVQDNNVASLLVQALRSNLPEKRVAVLDRLALPASKTMIPTVMEFLGNSLERPEKTTLDPLYEGFLKPLEIETSTPLAAPVARIPAAQAALVAELVKLTGDGSAPDLQFSAALALARVGQVDGLKTLVRLLPTLSTARKASIAEDLGEPSSREALPLLQALLRDPVDEIRKAAANSALSNDKAPAFTQLVLDELSRPETLLKPYEVYNYSFESISRSQTCGPALRSWALKTLQDSKSAASQKILACIAMGGQTPAAAVPLLVDLVKASPNAWVRRAAARTLGCTRPADWKALVEAVSQDPSPFVRETVPSIANRKYKSWTHYFDDAHSERDNNYYYESSSRPTAKSDPIILAALERLAAPSEISPIVRFGALFALMAQSKPVDVNAMVQLLGQQPEVERAFYQIAEWFENSANQAGPGLRPLFSAIDSSKIDADKLPLLVKRLNPEGSGAKAPVSFAALGSHAADVTATQQVAAAPEAPVKINRSSLPVVYFFKPGCRECAQAREMLTTLKKDHPTLVVEEHNILEADAVVLNQALCGRFQVPSLKHNIAPSLFTQTGYLVRDEILPPALAALLGKTADTDQDDAWKSVGEPQIEAAKEQVTQRYQALTLPVVIGAGLLDGVNPCAFATIIFFLSYLQIARRSKQEMLLTGASFILGVFLAYLAAGLLLYQALATLHERFAGIQNWLNPLFAALALLAALFSFRDALRARRGRMDEMTLQLPGFLKDRIRGVIRTGARARRFVIAAFLTGVAISFLELACTGQVYAPIVYQIQQGKLDAVVMLVIYNLAFIAPLIVIFLLAYGGLRSESLIALQKKHTFAVKIALGVLFLLLAAFILLGERMLGH